MTLIEKICSRVSLLRNTFKLLSVNTATNTADKTLSNIVGYSASYPAQISNVRSKLFTDTFKIKLVKNEFLTASFGTVVPQRHKHTGSKDNLRHRKDAVSISEGNQKYQPQSPYRDHWPRKYGYFPTYKKEGLLPRLDKAVVSMPKYRPKDRWDSKHALFGQNDYIDILGDQRISPVDLINGPSWLVGFRGNELQRLLRRMKFHGKIMRLKEPTKYNNIRKRIKFLYFRFNKRRSHLR